MYPLGAFSIMTSFLFDFPIELLYCKKSEISDSFIGKISYIIRKLTKKLHIRHLNGYLDFASYS
jgi:hypothetical protein